MVDKNSKLEVFDKLVEADYKCPKRILIVGECMVDVYIHGSHSSCQERCNKLIKEYEVQVPGGAANATRSISNWFSHTKIIWDKSFTSTKTRFIDIEDNICVYRYDNDNIISSVDLEYIHNSIIDVFWTDWIPDGVLISDYGKGLITAKFIKRLLGVCKLTNTPCIADCKQQPYIYDGCIMKFNMDYARKYKYCSQTAVVTRGSGMPFVMGDYVGLDSDLPNVKCINYVGAGDCFAAHLILGLTCGLSLKDASMIAHSAGRVYVQKLHNTPPRIEDIREDIKQYDLCLSGV